MLVTVQPKHGRALTDNRGQRGTDPVVRRLPTRHADLKIARAKAQRREGFSLPIAPHRGMDTDLKIARAKAQKREGSSLPLAPHRGMDTNVKIATFLSLSAIALWQYPDLLHQEDYATANSVIARRSGR
jgi:hypothetical protein